MAKAQLVACSLGESQGIKALNLIIVYKDTDYKINLSRYFTKNQGGLFSGLGLRMYQ